jgi:hypothetical protein
VVRIFSRHIAATRWVKCFCTCLSGIRVFLHVLVPCCDVNYDVNKPNVRFVFTPICIVWIRVLFMFVCIYLLKLVFNAIFISEIAFVYFNSNTRVARLEQELLIRPEHL